MSQEPNKLKLTVVCQEGFESLLLNELSEIIEPSSLEDTKVSRGLAQLAGTPSDMYRIVMWSRLATRVLVELFQCSTDELYQSAKDFAWSEVMTEGATFKIRTTQKHTNQNLTLRLKDAVVDHWTQAGKPRPTVSDQPDLLLALHIEKDNCTIRFDAGGGSLHQRGVLLERHSAPIKENIAAGLLRRLGWHQTDDPVLCDPMCGSGTFLVEAGWMYTDRAPALTRERFGFLGWRGHRASIWQQVVDEAKRRHENGTQRAKNLRLIGGDISSRAIGITRANLKRAGLSAQTLCGDAMDTIEKAGVHGRGTLISNLPYGHRIGETASLYSLHRKLGRSAGQHLGSDWSVGLLVGDEDLTEALDQPVKQRNKIRNGPLEVPFVVLNCRPQADQIAEEQRALFNRVKKNLRKRRQLATQQTDAYRIYDRDLPGFEFTVDRYGEHLFINEYLPSKELPPGQIVKRRSRMLEVLEDLNIAPAEHIVFRIRRRQPSSSTQQSPTVVVVEENGMHFECMLGQHLDAGLFLDHRPLRKWIKKEAPGKRLLNLFCYTGSIGVAAASAGAKTTNVDLSKAILKRAQKNYSLNGLPTNGWHRFVAADCRTFLENCQDGFDIIVLDPPTFSNSKRTEQDFDVQRDHEWFIRRCLSLLNPAGKLYFSTNSKKFKLSQALQTSSPVDLSEASCPEDFQRQPHRLWRFDTSASS